LRHEDIEAASRFLQASKPIRNVNRSALLSGVIIAVISVALLLGAQLLSERLPRELRVGPWAVVALFLPVVIIFPMVLAWVTYWKKGFTKGIRERTGESLSTPTTAEVTEEGLLTASESYRGVHYWRGLYDIASDEHYVCLMSSPVIGLVVPKRGFASPGEPAAFVEECRRRMIAAGGGRGAKS
jgi:hypothetical protein